MSAISAYKPRAIGSIPLAPVEQVVEVGVAVEVVEVLQQREVQGLPQHGIGLVARQPRSQVHGYLFVAERGLQRRLLARVEGR